MSNETIVDSAPNHSCGGAGRRRVERGIYVQPNGRFAVCFMVDRKSRFRTVDGSLEQARAVRLELIEAPRRGELAVAPALLFATVADRWIARYVSLVAAGLRRQRTLEAHRYYIDQHLRPRFGRRRVASITVADVCELIDGMRQDGRSEKTAAN